MRDSALDRVAKGLPGLAAGVGLRAGGIVHGVQRRVQFRRRRRFGVGNDLHGGIEGGLGGVLGGQSGGGIGVGVGGNLTGLIGGIGGAGVGGDLKGIAIGGLGAGAGEDIEGIVLAGLLARGGGDITGLTVGLGGVRAEETLKGISLSILSIGAEEQKGFSFSALNGYVFEDFWFRKINRTTTGISIGLINYAPELKGAQLGLLNFAGNNPKWARLLPFINLHL